MSKIIIIILTILLFGHSVTAQDNIHETLKAIRNGDIESLNKLISKENLNACFDLKGSSYNYLAISVKMKQIKSLNFFVEQGANLEASCTEKTPLMYSIKYGQLEMTQYLIEKGARITSKTKNGKTTLDYAIKYDHPDIETYLRSKLNKKQ